MEFGLGDGLAVLDLILTACKTLHCMIKNMKGNTERSERLSQRVNALQNLVLTIKQSGPSRISEPILNALRELKTSLACAEVMLIKYSKTKGIKSLVKSNGFEGKFQDMNQRLNENYFTLSGALQAEHREVLHKVYQTVSGGRTESQSSPAPPPVPLMVPQPPIVTVPVPPPGLLSPVQPPPVAGPVMAPPPFFFPPPPVPIITFTAPSPNIMVSPVSPVPPISTQVVFSSTLRPPLNPVLTTYTVRPPYFP